MTIAITYAYAEDVRRAKEAGAKSKKRQTCMFCVHCPVSVPYDPSPGEEAGCRKATFTLYRIRSLPAPVPVVVCRHYEFSAAQAKEHTLALIKAIQNKTSSSTLFINGREIK